MKPHGQFTQHSLQQNSLFPMLSFITFYHVWFRKYDTLMSLFINKTCVGHFVGHFVLYVLVHITIKEGIYETPVCQSASQSDYLLILRWFLYLWSNCHLWAKLTKLWESISQSLINPQGQPRPYSLQWNSLFRLLPTITFYHVWVSRYDIVRSACISEPSGRPFCRPFCIVFLSAYHPIGMQV